MAVGDEIQEVLEAMSAWIERRKHEGKWNLEIARSVARVQMGLWECAHDRPARSLVMRTLAEDVANLERALVPRPFTKSIWRAGTQPS
jgi:Tfp pilus assembly pilus retraction ATPase PilT